ncbi:MULTISPECIES: tyrosine-type recombinase/integrase [unclassified Nostoc]|uniref:tyrosine-type recombinase/integrase n=1 Tax=unclassified Nostoc TaxID=2593658 RepID=UPI002AD3B569|nr:tyrosine-type recombinase/integrase [Nostoc sp. DedQUE03]MDZ7974050.1 tyrosine-type recombinase/integrase [Nostoc sp. DedQUE03]MDZ8048551.1 tyrosine-type recombinase/integrase [Nostoc sp. DedQUE02]
MTEDKWISSDSRTKKLVIRFWVKGFTKQFFISTGLKDTKRNREIVRSKRDAIATDIALERFDLTLVSYNFSPTGRDNKFQIVEDAKPKYQYNILELWHKFTDFQETQLEQTTILGRYVYIKNYCNRLPTLSLDKASDIRDWLVKNASSFTARLILDYFDNCCRWALDSRLIYDNPFEKLVLNKRRTKVEERDCRAFSLEQRNAIIEAFENHELYSHYSAIVKFLFWTGCRPGEAFALSWDDVSTDCRKIIINKSCNKYKILKSTKNNRKRIFPTTQGSKLQELLLSLRSENNSSLIFRSKAGLPITSDLFKPAWTGYSTRQSGKTYRYMGVVQELAAQKRVPYLKPYATRHTFVTWAISNGVSPEKVALWIGDTVETVLRFYCHPNVVEAECPDF